MAYFKETLTAGFGVDVIGAGDFFRLIAAPADDLAVIFYSAGKEVARVEEVGAGYFESIEFDKVRLTSAAGGVVRGITRMGSKGGYDRPVGSVGISGTVAVNVQNQPAIQGAFAQAQETVTNASTEMLPAKAGRRYLLIQNNDPAGVIYVTLDGTAATVAKGIKLGPGQSLEIQGYAPTSAINAIGSIATQSNVVAVEA